MSTSIKEAVERDIKRLDRKIKAAGREALLSPSLAGKIEAKRRQKELAAERQQLRLNIFVIEDAGGKSNVKY